MMRAIQLAVACVAVLVATAGQAEAGIILMSTNGASSFNNTRASNLGHTVSTNSIAGIVGTPSSTLSGFDVVWINPDVNDYNSLRTGVASGGALEQFVSGGGVLVLNVAGNSGNQNDIAPGGVDYSRATTHNAEAFSSPTHPYLTGVGYGGSVLTPSNFVGWGSTDHGTLFNLLAGTTTVLSNTDGPSFVEYQYGNGSVLLNTLTYGWGTNGARGPALDNLINYSVFVSQQNSVSPVPEPSSLALFGIGACVAGLGAARRLRREKHRQATA